MLLCIFILYTAHPWVREGGNASGMPLDISVLSNMREFVKYSRLKQMALRVGVILKHKYLLLRHVSVHVKSIAEHCCRKAFLGFLDIFCDSCVKPLLHVNSGQALASTLGSDEIRDLRDQFDAIDMDGNGTITLDEIRHVSH